LSERILPLAFSALLASAIGAPAQASGCAAGYQVGDVNGDGHRDVGDVFYLVNALFAGGPASIGLADVNHDGHVDVGDVFYLINSLFAGGPAPIVLVPDHVAVGTPRPLTSVGGSSGSPASARCPPNAVVSGVRVFTDDVDGRISGVAVFCATPALTSGQSGYGLSFTPVDPSPYVGFSGSTTDGQLDGLCSAGAPAGWATVADAGSSVFGLALFCSAVGACSALDGTLTFTFSKSGAALGFDYGGGTSAEADCAANEALVGYDGRVGSFLVAIQPVCAPVVVAYK
jgi:hypothetical protein